VEEALRRSMNPGTAQDEHHWENWADFTAMRNIKEDEDYTVGAQRDNEASQSSCCMPFRFD
jgi:hypothetical protein